VDLYLHYQTIPDFVNYNYVDVTTASNFTLTIVDPLLGTWYLGFYALSDSSYSFTVNEQRSCPMNCSLHGSCIGSSCHCNASYTGLSCEEAVNSLASLSSTHGYVTANNWNFYKYIANSENPFRVRLTQKEATSNCDLYILSGAKPTRFVYEYANETLNHVTEILVSRPGNALWWIGIYGSSSCEYDILITQESQANGCGNCVQGTCVNNVCNCNPGWFGEDCSIKPEVLNNAVRTAIKPIQNPDWHYYVINVNHTSLLSIVLSEQTTTGQVWLYLSKENFPTLYNYEASNLASVANHRLLIEFLEPKSLEFVIGIYGSPWIVTSVQYSLVAFFTPF